MFFLVWVFILLKNNYLGKIGSFCFMLNVNWYINIDRVKCRKKEKVNIIIKRGLRLIIVDLCLFELV